MNKRTQQQYIARYILLDGFSAYLALVVFAITSGNSEHLLLESGILASLTPSWLLIVGIVVFYPLFWIALHSISGTYRNILRSSMVTLMGKTIFASFMGCIVIFGVVMYSSSPLYYDLQTLSAFPLLFGMHFMITAVARIILGTHIIKKLNNREIGFRTLLIGNKLSAKYLFDEMTSQKISAGNLFVGYASLNEAADCFLKGHLPHLGSFRNLAAIVKTHEIEETIIAIEHDEHDHLPLLLSLLSDNGMVIKATPELQDILMGKVKLSSIFGTPLALVQPAHMPYWQQLIKRLIDVLVSLAGILVLAPFFLILSILIKTSSKGPVLFRQERIGRHGKPFIMHKFRTMYQDAEKNGPQLSKENDPRITPMGRFLRKVRIDEIPQLYNVLIGNMSLVGPRPERQYYIDQIMEKAPQYKLILKIKPGLTGWGQVKQGYTENVDQMVSRLKYDLLYMGNMSLAIDLKIILHTLVIIFQGRGK